MRGGGRKMWVEFVVEEDGGGGGMKVGRMISVKKWMRGNRRGK